MITNEEFLDDKDVVTCPICGAIPTIDQPDPGTHCYSITYECGAIVVTAFGHRNSNKLDKSCIAKQDTYGVNTPRNYQSENSNQRFFNPK